MNGHASHSLLMAQLVYMADQLEVCVLSMQYVHEKKTFYSVFTRTSHCQCLELDMFVHVT